MAVSPIFVGGSDLLSVRKEDIQRTINMYPVVSESGSGKSQTYLQAIPGLGNGKTLINGQSDPSEFSAPIPPTHDCITGPAWSPATITTGTAWTAVASGLGLFVAGGQRISDGNPMVSLSSDGGVTWGAQIALTALGGFGIDGKLAFGNGKFAALVASNAGLYSSNGTSWATFTTPYVATKTGLAFGNGVFIGVDSTNHLIRTSDPSAWASIAMPSTNNWVCPCFGGGVWVVLSTGGVSARSTDNGLSWVAGPAIPSLSLTAAAFIGGVFVAVASDGTIIRSADLGLSWATVTFTGGGAWSALIARQGLFLAIDNTGGAILKSRDGLTWTTAAPVSVPPTSLTRWFAEGSDFGQYAAVAGAGGFAAYGIC